MLHLHPVRTPVTGRVVLSMFVLFMLSVLAVPAYAAGVQINERAPFEVLTFNACNGEVVMITGEEHLVGHLVHDSSGSSHVQALVQLHGTGVGEQGTRYVLNGTADEVANNFEDTGNGALEATLVINATLIGKGSTVNSMDRLLTHATINANGELTAAVQHQESKCNG